MLSRILFLLSAHPWILPQLFVRKSGCLLVFAFLHQLTSSCAMIGTAHSVLITVSLQAIQQKSQLQYTNAYRSSLIVQGCSEQIAPSMWCNHMNLHARGVYPGSVPTSWLESQGLFICSICQKLVAQSHSVSYRQNTQWSHVNLWNSLLGSQLAWVPLPTFEEIYHLQCNTIHHMPVKARPAFAHVLSACLRSAVIENTEEAWVKLFILPKCVLLTPKRGGHHHKPVCIDMLCELWSQGHIDTLWQRATSHTV